MGFSVKLAPGVRVRASSRGVRTSLGPRAARVHIGGGRTGFSMGVGPVTYSTSLGGDRPGSHRPSSRSTGTATSSRQLAAERAAGARAEKAAEGQRLQRQLDAIATIHRADFPPAQRPLAPTPPPVDRAALLAGHRRRAKNATSVFRRSARTAAYAQAARDAERQARELEATWREEQTAWQAQLDKEWALLRDNDPDTVLNVLTQAFEDNEAAAAAVGVVGAELTAIVVVPPPAVLPDRRPTLTPAGNLSLKKLTKRESSDLYKTLVCGDILVTIKESFAVAPSLTSIKAVAVRPTATATLGGMRTEVMVAAEFQKSRVQGFRWDCADPVQALEEVAEAHILLSRGATRELVPIDLDKNPELAEVAKVVDFEDLLGG